ncbi:MAG: gamma-glutamyltransferase [Bdellovibrionales bacterium]|nr:gamma-glutamyltransferase [Bdellovibrionales bacterium]
MRIGSYSILLLLISLCFYSCSHPNRFDGQMGNGENQRLLPLVKLLPGHTRSDHEAVTKNYMITSQGKHASLAGEKMFKMGGNAIDAAVAISFVISVERPQSTGLGGGGFMLIHGPQMKQPVAVDFRESAPLASFQKMYQDKSGKVLKRKSIDGPLAAGVPGLVAGLLEIHQRWGKLPIKKAMAPAIKLAREGFVVYPHLAKAIAKRQDVLKKYIGSKIIFLHPDNTPLTAGDTLVQRDLAKTLERISVEGKSAFYQGGIGNMIVAHQTKSGGLITQKDLSQYQVKYRQPVKGTYKGYKIYSMSPPSSGGVHIIQMLNMTERLQLDTPLSANTIHLVSSIMQMAYADRAKYLGDSDFQRVPVKGLISKQYAIDRLRYLGRKVHRSSAEVDYGNPLRYESDETTHLTVMDKKGYVVTSTQTVNGYMGSGVVVPGTGILLNNEMDDFAAKLGESNMFGAIGGENNLVEPGKRPLSSMSPTIVTDKNDKVIMALGTPSGTRIINCVFQTILNYLEFKLPLYDSVALVRYHHQWKPDYLRVGAPYLPPLVEQALKQRGHTVKHKNLGCRVNAITREDEMLHGVSDPRGEGLSIGG